MSNSNYFPTKKQLLDSGFGSPRVSAGTFRWFALVYRYLGTTHRYSCSGNYGDRGARRKNCALLNGHELDSKGSWMGKNTAIVEGVSL